MTRFRESVVHVAFWSVLACSPSACAQDGGVVSPPERISFAAYPIQGGYADANTKAAVGIYRYQSGQVTASCSGSLIAPNVVLTARHCVASINGDPSQCTSGATFGTSWPASQLRVFNDQTVTSQTQYYNVSQIIVPSENRTCGRDIALLILSQKLDASVATPVEPRIDEQPHVFEKYSAVGYGNTCGTCQDGGHARNRRDNLQVSCMGTCGYPQYAAVEEWWGGDGVCSGDSGGPAFDAQGRVIGVASRAAVTGNTCVQSIYQRVDAESQVIIDAVLQGATVGGYAPPAWTTYDGGAGGDSTQNCTDCENGSIVPGAPCESTFTACSNSADCAAYLQCMQGCTTNTCVVGCYRSHPAGVIQYGAVDDCFCGQTCSQFCATQCAVSQCGLDINNTTCNTCFQQNCCTQGHACAVDHACQGLVVCASTCTTQTCVNSCRTGYQAGTALYDAVNTCLQTTCGAQCGGGTGGSGGSGAGGFTGGAGGGDGGSAGVAGEAGSGAGGAATGGDGGMGGVPAGGAAGDPGAGGAGNDAGPGGSPQAGEDLQVAQDNGCGCRVASSNSPGRLALVGALAALGALVLRRRRGLNRL